MSQDSATLRYDLLAINGSTTSRGAQAFTFDEINRHLYVSEGGAITQYPMDGGIGVSPISATLVGGAAIGHQGLSTEYLPNKIKLWTTSSVVGRAAVRFDYVANTAIDTGDVYELFTNKLFANSTSCTPTVSTDGKYLVAHGTRFGTSITVIRVFELAKLVAGGPGDYSSAYLYEWETQNLVNSLNPMQGIACDDKYIYLNAGGTGFDRTLNKRLHIHTITGTLIYRNNNCVVGRSAALNDPRYTRYEPEGLAISKGADGKPLLNMGILSGDPGMRRFRIYKFTSELRDYLDRRVGNKLAWIEDFTDGVIRSTAVPINSANKILRTDADGVFQANSLVRGTSIIENDTELEIMKGSKESFADIFNWWQRISRGGPTFTDNYKPAELDTWQYNADTDTVVNPINSGSVIGFISPDKFDNYVLDTQMSSIGNDDDFIGVIIAYAVDPVDNTTHILTAIRGGNGTAPMVIDKDYYGYNVRRYSVGAVYNGLTWCNGVVANTTNGVNGANGRWFTAGVGCRLKITRRGDIITVETSQYNSKDLFEPAKFTFDLSADPNLAVFRGEQSYGYVAVSQPMATWVVNKRPEIRDPIIDIRDWSTWTYIDDAWVKATGTKQTVLARGLLTSDWLHQNITTRKFFYLNAANQLYRL